MKRLINKKLPVAMEIDAKAEDDGSQEHIQNEQGPIRALPL